MSSSNSPCAACKFLRRKCTQECVFAPYFPADQPKRFADVHKVFGASNVAKILNEIDVSHREDAVNSLAYEAEARLQDPVYGCMGAISLMQQQLKSLHLTLEDSKKELASLVGPTVMMQMLQDPFFRAHYHPMGAAAASSSNPGAVVGMTDLQQQFQQQQIGAQVMQSFLLPPQQQQQAQLVIRERQQQSHKQQLLERQMMARQQQQQLHGGPIVIRDHIQFQAQQAQIQAQQQAQFAAAEMQVREEQEMMRKYEQQQQQQAQIQAQQQAQQAQQQAQQQHQQQAQLMRFHGEQFGPSGAVEMAPMLALGSGFEDHNPYHVQQQEPLLMLQQPQQQDPQAILQIQQQEQQQEIQDIQDNPLFHDHNLHTPEPGHDLEGLH